MRVLLVVLLLVAVGFAGCGDKDDGKGDGKTSTSGTSTGTGSTSGSGTKSSGTKSSTGTSTGPLHRTAALAADVLNGTAPVPVNFTLGASPGQSSWRLVFGDGGVTNGTVLPTTVNHTYVVGGNFSALLTVTFPSGDATARVNLTIGVPPQDPLVLPNPAHFEFGPSLGCVGDLGAESCLSFTGGPDATGIDGHWLALDDRYWGLHLTSTTSQSPAGPVPVPGFGNVGADSDCVFTDAAHEVVGEADNGSDSCNGLVPNGTVFLFIYPYVAPATEIVVDFVLPTA